MDSRSNRSGSSRGESHGRGRSPGEKPVLNEKFDEKSRGILSSTPKFPSSPAKTVEPIVPMDDDSLNSGTSVPKTGKKSTADKHFNEGLRLFRIKRWENAQNEFRLVETDGFTMEEHAELAYYLGLCCTKLEQYDDALLYFEQVIMADIDPLRGYQCRMTLAYIYVITGRARMAEIELKRLQSGGFESAQLYNTLAYAAYTQKRDKNAVELYERALEIDKENATAMNSMGYILADTGLDAVKGLGLCRKAVEIRPKNAAYLDSLGWACYKCGEVTEAGDWLRRAMDIAPQEKEIRKHFKIVTGEAV